MGNDLKIFSDLSHPQLAKEICRELGLELGKAEIKIFSNENPIVEIGECVRGGDVFVIGTQAPPVAQNFLCYCILINALRYASASRITAVIPYLFESRADKKDRPRISIVARLIAQFIETAGVDRGLFMDLHAAQIQGFFRLPTDIVNGAGLICEFLNKRDLSDYILVAPDAGEAKKIHPFQEMLPNLPLAMFDKRRFAHDEKPVIRQLVGEVDGKVALLIDDEIAGGGTIKEAMDFFNKLPKEKQPREVRTAITHPVLCGQAISVLNQSGIKELIAVDTIPVPPEKSQAAEFEFHLLSPAQILAKAIKAIHTNESMGDLLQRENYETLR